MPISNEYGMNPRAMIGVTVGCARVGASSLTALASVSHEQDTPAEARLQTSEMIVFTFATGQDSRRSAVRSRCATDRARRHTHSARGVRQGRGAELLVLAQGHRLRAGEHRVLVDQQAHERGAVLRVSVIVTMRAMTSPSVFLSWVSSSSRTRSPWAALRCLAVSRARRAESRSSLCRVADAGVVGGGASETPYLARGAATVTASGRPCWRHRPARRGARGVRRRADSTLPCSVVLRERSPARRVDAAHLSFELVAA